MGGANRPACLRRPPHRLLRAFVLTGAAVAVGAARTCSGAPPSTRSPSPWRFPVLLGLSWPLTDRERGWLPIAGAQLAGQQVVHTLLSRAGDAVEPGLPVDVFLYGHVVAAALVAVWLRRGEQRTWAAARRAARMVAVWWARLLVLLVSGAPPRPARPSRRRCRWSAFSPAAARGRPPRPTACHA